MALLGLGHQTQPRGPPRNPSPGAAPPSPTLEYAHSAPNQTGRSKNWSRGSFHARSRCPVKPPFVLSPAAPDPSLLSTRSCPFPSRVFFASLHLLHITFIPIPRGSFTYRQKLHFLSANLSFRPPTLEHTNFRCIRVLSAFTFVFCHQLTGTVLPLTGAADPEGRPKE